MNLGHLWHEPDKVLKWVEVLMSGIENGWIRPHVDRSFSFDEIRAAHAHMEGRRNIGKVVLVP